MFLSPYRCRGLKVLVDLLDEDYTDQTELVVDALNGIGSVFELQTPTTKNDFCRMFIREGLLDPLSSALLNVMGNSSPNAVQMKHKIIQILLVFSQVTQSDIHVRNAMGTRKIVRREIFVSITKFDAPDRNYDGRFITCMRAFGDGMPSSDAKSCEALVHECQSTRGASKRQRHRNTHQTTGRRKDRSSQHGKP
jgi:hypothetical protein